MGSEGSHSTQNDTPFAPVDELEAQNNKIAMNNEILQEQYEKVFEMLHEARYTKTHELITLVEVNHQLGAPQHKRSFASTWVFLLRSELLIEMATNMILLSTQLFRLEAEGVEESTSLLKEWKDRKPSFATVETS
ncbi:hypothetical protein ACFX19_033068 [Malus domestica]